MNFLPEEDKKMIRKECWRRFFVVAGPFSFLAFLIGILLLFPSYVLLKSGESDLVRQVAISEERLKRSQTGEVTPLVKDLNAKISFLEKERKTIEEKNPAIKNILEEKPPEVKINNLFLDKKRIVIQGFSSTRSGLLLFIDNLKKKGFEKTESPIANIIKEKDIEFSINIEL